MKEHTPRIANYHTHTTRCGHAEGGDEEYVRAAIAAGWRTLGFSDHAPWPYESGFRNPTVRMTVAELPEYLASLRAMREKYRDAIRIYIGLECEYFPAYMDWLRALKEEELDYLILGNHFDRSDETGIYYGAATTPEQLMSYCDNTIRGMETGLFACLAHPDLALMNYPVFDDAAREMSYRLCHRAKALGLPLEYNLQGQRLAERGKAKGLGYPYAGFWQVAKEVGNEVILGMDAHSPDALADDERYRRERARLESWGVRLIDKLPRLP